MLDYMVITVSHSCLVFKGKNTDKSLQIKDIIIYWNIGESIDFAQSNICCKVLIFKLERESSMHFMKICHAKIHKI